jgi:6-phosphogluconolactonase (cycloisomerase 2 family)
LYLASDGFIMGYTIDSNSGALTPLTAVPFPDSTVIIAPHAMIADPNGTFLVTSNLTPDTSPSFTQVITINTANGQLTGGGTAQGANSTATVSPLAIDQMGQHVYGIGLLDTTCATACTKAVDSFAVNSSTITTIGTPASTGLQGSNSIALSPF